MRCVNVDGCRTSHDWLRTTTHRAIGCSCHALRAGHVSTLHLGKWKWEMHFGFSHLRILEAGERAGGGGVVRNGLNGRLRVEWARLLRERRSHNHSRTYGVGSGLFLPNDFRLAV